MSSSGIARPPLRRNIGDAHDAAGPKHPVTRVEKGPPGPEMECRFHADDPVGRARGDRQPDRIADYRRGSGRSKPIPAGQGSTPVSGSWYASASRRRSTGYRTHAQQDGEKTSNVIASQP
jgi:hypothetical protein